MVLTIVDVVLSDLVSGAELTDIGVPSLVALDIGVTHTSWRLRRQFRDVFLGQILDVGVHFYLSTVLHSPLDRIQETVMLLGG